MQYKVIVTGAHSLVGEGVLMQCLENDAISEVLLISRWPNETKHKKVKELIIQDFLALDEYFEELTGYDACFYCLENPVASLDERIYAHFAIDITLSLASHLILLNPNIAFSFVSKRDADNSGLGKIMADIIIDKTEKLLSRLIFRKLYFFRVALVSPLKKQKRDGVFDKVFYLFYPLLRLIMPNKINSTKEIGLALINALITKYPERILRVEDIRALACQKHSLTNVSTSLVY
ncbi:MAG: epimerase [Pedobacter sp.]|nr:MAG: epimerase [Pedobacter sp.]